MSYVTAVVMQFTTRNAQEVSIKARGKFISRAVDVAEISCRRFLEGIALIKDIRIGSDVMNTPEGKTIRASTIEIVLCKK